MGHMNVRNVQKLNERELEQGASSNTSWHRQYKDSAWVFIGGLPYELTEGDVIAVFSQYGEVMNMNLVRDKTSGKSKGFCFLCYEDQRSTVLAVDNLNSIKLMGRTIRVDHCENYKPPKVTGDEDDTTKTLHLEGCAPLKGVNVIPEVEQNPRHERKKENKKHKKKRKHKDDSNSSDEERVKVKKEKFDPGYEKYSHASSHHKRSRERQTSKERQRSHKSPTSHDSHGQNKRENKPRHKSDRSRDR